MVQQSIIKVQNENNTKVIAIQPQTHPNFIIKIEWKTSEIMS